VFRTYFEDARKQKQSWWISTTADGYFEPKKKLMLLAICLDGAKFREILSWTLDQPSKLTQRLRAGVNSFAPSALDK
jgi:hypothetical protein